ncbi:unnamed protein product, partial [Miscanthus lutarioriparius]
MSHLSDSQTGSARSGRHRGEEGDERRSGAGGWAVGKAVRGRNRGSLPSARKRRNRTEAIKASRGALLPSPNREVKASSRPHFAADPRKAEGASSQSAASGPLFPTELAGVPLLLLPVVRRVMMILESKIYWDLAPEY